MNAIEAAARAMRDAECLGREGPFGGYDYGHNTDFYGPAPKDGRYVIRDFRYSHSKGEWLYQTDDSAAHDAMFEKMTAEHLATAAIIAFLRNCEVSEEMELDGVDAWHDSGVGIDVQIRAAFKAMVARQADELERTDK